MPDIKNEAVAEGWWRGHWLRNSAADAWGGFTAALIAIPHAMGLGLLAFAALGPAYAPVGVAAGLLSVVVGNLVGGLLPSARCQLMGARTSATVVFAGIIATLAAHPSLQVAGGADVPKVLTLAFMALFLSGVIQMLFGLVGLGRIIKFVPYPVIAGFMNGIAILMLISQVAPALGLEAGRSVKDVFTGTELIRPASLLVAGMVVAMIYAVPRFTRKIPALLCGLLLGVLAHHLLAWLAPASVGPLVGALPIAEFAPREMVAMIHLAGTEPLVIWLVYLLPGAALLAAVVALDGLLAAVVTDPLTRSRHDSNRLLKAQGAANALAAAFGALPSAASAHTRVAAYLAGARTPAVALFHALFMLSAIFVLAPLISVIPVSALAGVIIYIALTLVDRWTRDLLRRLGNDGDKTEILLNIAVVCGVTLSLLIFNIIVAFGIGIAAAVVLLLVRLSGSPVRRALDGSIRSSLKVRGPDERAMLLPKSKLISILELEGTLFFGTTDRLQTLVENLPEETRFVILDFRMVTGIDASGARSLETMGHMAMSRGMRILLSHVREDDSHGRYLRALGIDAVVGSAHWFADLDRALEWAEDALLDRERFEDAPEIDPRDMALFSGLGADEMTTVCAVLERREFAHRDVIFNEGDEDDSVYLIARGSVSIKLQLGDDTRARRLATFMPGVFFGEMAMIEGQRRSADAFANGERVVLYSLSAQGLAQIVQQNPQLGIKLYKNLSLELATRLRVTSSALRALE